MGRPNGLGPPRWVAADAALLVVEDSPADRRLLLAALVDAGFGADAITVVTSARDAQRALARTRFACVLLDLALDDVEGLSAVTRVAGADPDVPIVVVSGRTSDAALYGAMSEGADEYLTKADLAPARLLDLIERATRRRRGGRRGTTARLREVAALDSLDVPTATIDAGGRITAVNEAWAIAARADGADPAALGVGHSYLAVCDGAPGALGEGAAEIAAGIRAVLSGRSERRTVDYRTPSDEGDERWFSTRITPLPGPAGGAVVVHLDISDLKAVERRLQRTESGLHRALDQSSPVFALIDADGCVLSASRDAERLLGLREHGRVRPALDRIDPTDRPKVDAAVAEILAAPGTNLDVAVRVVDDEGRWRDVDLTVVNLLDDPSAAAVAVVGRDVTDGRRTQITGRLESRLLRQLPTAVVVVDDRGVVVYWNDMAAATYGYTAEQAVGRLAAELDIGPTDGTVAAEIDAAVRTSGQWEGDYDARHAGGDVTPVHARYERVAEPDIGFAGRVGAMIDITDRRRLEHEMAYQALHDPLTGLPNRRLFMEKVDGALARAHRHGTRVAVIFVDLDDFKAINDTVGHVGADEILAVAELIQGVLRTTDDVARFGGDEFVVCCSDVTDVDEVGHVVQRMVDAFCSSPFRAHSGEVQVTASIGVALSSEGAHAEAMVRDADAAMYVAKGAGKARVEIIDGEVLDLRERQRASAR